MDGTIEDVEDLSQLLAEVDFGLIGFGAVGVVVIFALLLWVVTKVLCICAPNEILVISGRQHTLADGSTVGYKVLHGGRGIRIPVIEEVNRMDMRLIPVMVEVKNAFSKGGIALEMHAVANVKITSDRAKVRNAIERLLVMSPRQIGVVAQQTLEGALREVVSELTPEEVNQDRLKFAETLMRNAKDDFDKLGLELDVLKIQSVSDEQGYLRSMGRTQIARMVRDAENAENASKQAIAESSAAAKQRSQTAIKQAEALVLTRKNELRAIQAQLDAEAKGVENEAAVAAETARSQAEQELQTLRTELEKQRLQVDVFLPAEAQRLASQEHAKAEASPVIESGRAAAEALGYVAKVWSAAGQSGRDLYVLSNLSRFVHAASQRVQGASIGELNVVDSGDGRSFASAVAMYPAAVAQVLRETGKVLGVDMDALMSGNPTNKSGGAL
jgi:flotillin